MRFQGSEVNDKMNRTRRDPKGRMEEEIIGNRWKELDYDGYYLSRLLP